LNTYELLGRKCEELENAIAEHFKTLALLKNLKSGKVKIEDVEVEDTGWRLK